MLSLWWNFLHSIMGNVVFHYESTLLNREREVFEVFRFSSQNVAVMSIEQQMTVCRSREWSFKILLQHIFCTLCFHQFKHDDVHTVRASLCSVMQFLFSLKPGVLSIFAALSKNATVARIDHRTPIKVVWNTIIIQF